MGQFQISRENITGACPVPTLPKTMYSEWSYTLLRTLIEASPKPTVAGVPAGCGVCSPGANGASVALAPFGHWVRLWYTDFCSSLSGLGRGHHSTGSPTYLFVTSSTHMWTVAPCPWFCMFCLAGFIPSPLRVCPGGRLPTRSFEITSLLLWLLLIFLVVVPSKGSCNCHCAAVDCSFFVCFSLKIIILPKFTMSSSCSRKDQMGHRIWRRPTSEPTTAWKGL